MTITLKDRRPDTDHKTRMAVRRARQRARTVGFTPVTNQKIQLAVTGLTSTLIKMNREAIERGDEGVEELEAPEANSQAWAIVRQTLPPNQIGVRVRPQYGTGKSYRKEAA